MFGLPVGLARHFALDALGIEEHIAPQATVIKRVAGLDHDIALIVLDRTGEDVVPALDLSGGGLGLGFAGLGLMCA